MTRTIVVAWSDGKTERLDQGYFDACSQSGTLPQSFVEVCRCFRAWDPGVRIWEEFS